MSMKRTIAVSILAAAVSASAAGGVQAASVKHTAVAEQLTALVNDAAVNVRSVKLNGITLYSVRDLGTAAGALFVVTGPGAVTAYFQGHAIELHSSSKQVTVDGAAGELQTAIENVANSYYMTIDDFAAAFSVTAAIDETGKIVVDAVDKLQDVDSVSWIDAGHLLASKLTEEGRTDYLVDAATGKYTELLKSSGASDLVVSPNGQKAAYTDESGAVYVLDLATKQSSIVSSDSSIKPELVWSSDGGSIYFLQGDKGSVIAKLSLADGKISKVLEDKVDYKANLAVSADGTKFIYTVTKPGAVKADSSKPVEQDDVAIDMTGTEPQVFRFDSSVKDGKPEQLTSGTDDKVFVGAAADGSRAFYVSAAENALSKLVAVGSDKQSSTLIGDKDVLEAVQAGDKLYALVDNGNGSAVVEVDAAGNKKELYAVSADVSEVIASSGTPVAIVENGKVQVEQGGKWKSVTK
jgi:Tol biopolymer transport system component